MIVSVVGRPVTLRCKSCAAAVGILARSAFAWVEDSRIEGGGDRASSDDAIDDSDPMRRNNICWNVMPKLWREPSRSDSVLSSDSLTVILPRLGDETGSSTNVSTTTSEG